MEKNEHLECGVSDCDLFTPSLVQTDIANGFYEDLFPVTSLDDSGHIEFCIENNSDKFIDLANSYLHLKFKITRADGTNLTNGNAVSGINYPIATLFKQVDIFLSNKLISSSTSTYSFRTYLEVLLNYGRDAKKSHLQMGLFYKDAAGYMDDFTIRDGNNFGLRARHGFGINSQVIFVSGRIHNDLFHQGRLLLNSVPLKIVLHRNKDNFVLLSAENNASYKVKIIDAVFRIRKVELNPVKYMEIQKALEKGPALYPINRVDLKVFSVAAGFTNVNWENAIMGNLPNRIFLMMVDNAAFSGTYGTNPFNFKNNGVSGIGIYVNGKCLPNNHPLTMNFEGGDYLDAYRSLFQACGKLSRDEGFDVNLMEYKSGYSVFGFDLSPGLSHGEHQELKKNGNLRISLQFAAALQRPVSIILYAEFDNNLSIYKSREVLKDY